MAVFVEPASAASVAGLLQVAAAGELEPGQRVVCTVTGNGLKDPEWAISGAPAPRTIPVDAGGGRGPARPVTPVRVRVPATSANLGPAFDCAGLALSRYDVLEFAVLPSGLDVSVSGVGAGELPTDESHLVVRAFRAACDQLGWTPPGLRVVADNGIPQGRGMGSSAAAVVAGVVGAWALCPDVDDIDDDAVLRLTTELEGHPGQRGALPARRGDAVLDDGRTVRGAVRLDVAPGHPSRRARARRRPCRPTSPAGCCPTWCRTPTPPSTPPARRCWCTR